MAHVANDGRPATEPGMGAQEAAAVSQLVGWLVAHVRAADASRAGTFGRFATLAADLVPGGEACSIAAYTPDGARTIAASDATAMKLGRYQCRVGDGPAIRSALAGAVIEVADTEHDDRWPRFGKHASALGIRSVLCVSATGAADLRLVLTISSTEAGAFRGYGTSSLVACVRDVLAAGALVTAERGMLRRRLAHLNSSARQIGDVERAEGIVMAVNRCSVQEAGDELHSAATQAGVPAGEFAERIVTGDLKPWDDGFPRYCGMPAG